MATAGIWAPDRRRLTVGLLVSITLVAFESLAVATILPDIKDDLGGLGLYGWVFSAFFLGSILGAVACGQATDRRGPAAAYAAGLVLFATGLLAGGLAPSMLVLVVARFVQGIGGGAVPATAYVAIGRAYPEPLQPRVFAMLATAWVVPGLVGPGIASMVSNAVGWRWVFLGLLPLSAGAGSIAYRALRPLRIVDGTTAPSRLPDAVRVTVGAGLVLAGLGADVPVVAAGGVVLGVALAARALVRLVPRGTLRAQRGLPAAVLARGVLTFAFFGADAYIPLAVTDVRHSSTLIAGVTLTTSALSWTTASWVQERLVDRVGARLLVTTGHAIVLAGIALAGTTLIEAVPLVVLVVAWTVAGFGIGLAYSPISVTVLRCAPPGEEGAATSGMQLTDLLGVALGTGIGGAAVALGDALDWSPATGIGIAWVLAAAMATVGIVVGRRLPGREEIAEEHAAHQGSARAGAHGFEQAPTI